jgi:hypothetical protein
MARGFTALQPSINNSFSPSPNEGQIINARVVDIILDETHPKWDIFGGWNGIGTIEFVLLENINQQDTTTAIPLFPQLKNYPLINETVLIFSFPNRNIDKYSNVKGYYYLNPINLWNHPHHNAFPDVFKSETTDAQNADYESIQGGQVRRIKDNSSEIELNSPEIGGTFVEKANIHPILPFAGDNILEGRFGNSLRLGNTSKTKGEIKNNWSLSGENGDPITILRNGQDPNSGEKGWIPVTENINNDLSSIYLTSTQQIPLNTDFPDFPALKKNPESLSEYSKNQIILSSGRLVFNSKGDSIFLSSNKSISLNASEDIALFSRNSNIALQGKEIKLGEKTASEPIILGNKFMEGFEQLLFGISLLCDSLSAEPFLGPSSATASNLKQMAENMKSQLNQYLSKSVKSI